MTSPDKSDSIAHLYAALMPALTKASIGDFSGEIDISGTTDRRSGEILVGVQVLLDVINEKILELERANARLVAARDRSVTLLDEVLGKTID